MPPWEDFDAPDGTAVSVDGPFVNGINIADLQIYGGKVRNVGTGTASARRLISNPDISEISVGPYTSGVMDKMPAARMSFANTGYTARLANATGGNWQRVTLQRDGANLLRSGFTFSFPQNQWHRLRVTVTPSGGSVIVRAYVNGALCLEETDASPLTGVNSGFVIVTAPGIAVEDTEIDDWSDYILPRTYQSDRGAFALSGQAADLLLSRKLEIDFAALTLSADAVTLAASVLAGFDVGTIALDGFAADLTHHRSIDASHGAALASAEPVELRCARTIPLDDGAVNADPVPADLLAARLAISEHGAHSAIWPVADLFASRLLDAPAGTSSATPQAAGLTANRSLAADTWVAGASAADTALPASRLLQAASATFQAFGSTITTGNDLRLEADTGAATMQGQVAQLAAALIRSADAGSAQLVGQPATITAERTIVADQAITGASGQAVDFYPGRAMPADYGSLSALPSPSDLICSRVLAPDGRALAISAPSTQTAAGRLLNASAGSLAANTHAATFAAARSLVAALAEIEAEPRSADVIYIPAVVYTLPTTTLAAQAFVADVVLAANRLLSPARSYLQASAQVGGLWCGYPVNATPAELSVTTGSAEVIATRRLVLESVTVGLNGIVARLDEIEPSDTKTTRLVVVFSDDSHRDVVINSAPRVTLLPPFVSAYL